MQPNFFNQMNMSAVAAFGEDLIKMRMGVSFFKASGPGDDCANVPADVSKTPVIEACNGVRLIVIVIVVAADVGVVDAVVVPFYNAI